MASTFTKEQLEATTPRDAYQKLKEGNKRFKAKSHEKRDLLQQANDSAGGQHPFATILSCMDSRTSVELIFDQGLGDVFSIRIAGNVVNDDIIGSMEFATQVVGSKLLVVLGHTSCGAVKGAVQDVELGRLTGLLEKIKPAIAKAGSTAGIPADANEVDKAAYANVVMGIDDILQKSGIIKKLFDEGKIGLVGGVYDVATGEVNFFHERFNG